MPISLRYASALNASSVACCAFQPKRPTRRSPDARSTTIAARPDAVAIAIGRVLERQQRLVRDCFDQTGAKHWNGHAPHDDRRLGRNHRLACMAGDGEKVEQRFARWSSAMNSPRGPRRPARTSAIVLVPPTAGTLWQNGAARRVERRTEPLVRRLDFEEVIETKPELFEFDWCDSRQRVARNGHTHLGNEIAPASAIRETRAVTVKKGFTPVTPR